MGNVDFSQRPRRGTQIWCLIVKAAQNDSRPVGRSYRTVTCVCAENTSRPGQVAQEQRAFAYRSLFGGQAARLHRAQQDEPSGGAIDRSQTFPIPERRPAAANQVRVLLSQGVE